MLNEEERLARLFRLKMMNVWKMSFSEIREVRAEIKELESLPVEEAVAPAPWSMNVYSGNALMFRYVL